MTDREDAIECVWLLTSVFVTINVFLFLICGGIYSFTLGKYLEPPTFFLRSFPIAVVVMSLFQFFVLGWVLIALFTQRLQRCVASLLLIGVLFQICCLIAGAALVSKLECCGFTDATVYGNDTPESCLSKKRQTFDQGCSEPLKHYFRVQHLVITIVGFFLGFFESIYAASIVCISTASFGQNARNR